MYYVILSIPFIISAIICHYVAKQRGSNVSFWGVMGLVFGPLAISFVFLSNLSKK